MTDMTEEQQELTPGGSGPGAGPNPPGTRSVPPEQAVVPTEKLPAGNGEKPIAKLRDLLEKARPQITRVLPEHVNATKLIQLALVAVSREPKLLECSAQSIPRALMISAQLGLEPSGPQGHGWILPYWNEKKTAMEAEWQTGYKGYIELALRSGRIDSVSARVVYEHDQFEFEYGTLERIKHVPTLNADRGKPTCAYMVARLKGNAASIIEVVPLHEIERIRTLSKAKNSPAWANHWEMMARKTAVRRGANYLPQSADLATAMEIENRFEQGEADTSDIVPVITGLEDEKPATTKTDRLKSEIAKGS